MAKRETNDERVRSQDERWERRALEWCKVLIAEDPNSEEEDPRTTTLVALRGAARRDIDELTKQIRRVCFDKKWTSYQKRVACEELVKLAFLSTESMYRLAKEFPEPFREIAEELSHFPCLFPVHADSLRALQKVMWNGFNLGKRHMFKLRAGRGRKTFSTKTWVNKLLISLIDLVHEEARHYDKLDADWKHLKEYRELVRHAPLSLQQNLKQWLDDLAHEEARHYDKLDPDWEHLKEYRELVRHVPLSLQNVKQWLDAMWKLLLITKPEPEKHPRLRQLGERPSRKKQRTRYDGTVGKKTQAHNVRASIKAKLGVYLKRMLNDSAVKQIAE